MSTSSLEYQRVHRANNRDAYNASARRYRRTPKGQITQVYNGMRYRVEGRVRGKEHLYAGLPLLSRASFYEWAMGDTEYHRLHMIWKMAGYPMRLAPSIDRIDSNRGYVLGNIRWITQSVNSALAHVSPKRSNVLNAIRRALGQAT